MELPTQASKVDGRWSIAFAASSSIVNRRGFAMCGPISPLLDQEADLFGPALRVAYSLSTMERASTLGSLAPTKRALAGCADRVRIESGTGRQANTFTTPSSTLSTNRRDIYGSRKL